MKTSLIVIGLALTASAQNHPFVFRSEIKTNPPQHVAASGVTLAHDVLTVVEIAYVATADSKGVAAFDHPAVRVISQTTNIVDKPQVQKPLLSAQRPAAKGPAPLSKPAAKIPGPPTSMNTNSPAYRRAHKLPPFDK